MIGKIKKKKFFSKTWLNKKSNKNAPFILKLITIILQRKANIFQMTNQKLKKINKQIKKQNALTNLKLIKPRPIKSKIKINKMIYTLFLELINIYKKLIEKIYLNNKKKMLKIKYSIIHLNMI